ncbi:MAG: VOC family protein [Lachnospiraceae bacterium]
MKLKNILIVTEDLERSKKFYKDLFGLDVILDQDGNVILAEGLVLQDKKVWEAALEKPVLSKNHAAELYFEEMDIEGFLKKLESYDLPIVYVNCLTEFPWGQKMVRFYDPDGNLIEVRTPV